MCQVHRTLTYAKAFIFDLHKIMILMFTMSTKSLKKKLFCKVKPKSSLQRDEIALNEQHSNRNITI